MQQKTYRIKGNEELPELIGKIRETGLCEEAQNCLLFVHENIDDEARMRENIDALTAAFPGVTVFGLTMFGPTYPGLTLPVGTDVSLLHFDRSSFRILLYEIDKMTPEEAADSLSRTLAGMSDVKGLFCAPAGADTMPDAFLRKTRQRHRDIPLFGVQTAAYSRMTGAEPTVFLNGKPYHNVIPVIVFSGSDLHISTGFNLGYKAVGKTMEITDSNGRELVRKIDGITPNDLYRRYLHLDHAPGYYEAVAFPLLVGDEDSQIVRVSVDHTPEGFTFNAPMPVGAHVTFSYGRERTLLRESLELANRMNAFRPQALFCTFCQNRRAFLGNTLSDRELDYYRAVSPEVLFANGYGEILQEGGKGGLRSNTIVAAAMREGDAQGEAVPVTDDHLTDADLHNTYLGTLIVNLLEEISKDLKEMASLDSQTGLYNRGALESWVSSLGSEPVSALLFDLDHFKRVNDAYGHDTGDLTIRNIAGILQTYQSDDFRAARWGGDNFLCVSRSLDDHEMMRLAENLRKTIETDAFCARYGITISGGVAACRNAGEDLSELYRNADRAMYHSKHFGGNRVTEYSARLSDEMEQGRKTYSFSPELRNFIEGTGDPVIIYQIRDHGYHIIAVSDGYCRLMNADRAEMMLYLNSHSLSRVYPDDADRLSAAILEMQNRDTGSLIYRHRIGDEYHYILCTGSRQVMETGAVIITARMVDLNSADEVNKSVYRKYVSGQNDAFYRDNVTGLPSINYFNTFADSRILELQEQHRTPVVIYFDIAGMHAFNERFGYAEGNRLLTAVGNILLEMVPEDLVVRYAEDHFVVITGQETDPPAFIQEVNRKLAEQLRQGNARVKAGFYEIRKTDEKAVTALDKARQALNYIGGDRSQDVCVYDGKVSSHFEEREYVLSHFQDALSKGWIQTWYQPLVRTLTGKVCGSEALARWADPDRGILPPFVFIKPLEDAHLIHLLDLEIIRQVCATLRRFMDQGIATQSISVNLSRADFTACDIFGEIEKIRAEYRIPAGYLHIEITESTLSSEPELMKAVLQKFHDHGYSVWMDDFGSDYANLNLMKDFHFDWLKIDLGFLRTFDTNPASRTIIASIVDLAKRLGTHTLCEGVETEEQYNFLRDIGCELAQGYLFSKPIPLHEMVDYIKRIGHDRYEPMEENAYYNRCGLINYMGDPTAPETNVGVRPLTVVEKDENGVIRHIFTSASYRKQAERLGIDLDALHNEANENDKEFSVMIRDMMARAEQEGRIIQQINTVRGYRFDVRVRFLSTNGKRALYAESVVFVHLEDVK